MLRLVMLVVGLSMVAAAVKFPSYITKCAQNDPAFNKCALASARAAKDNLVRGDRAFRLLPMDPLRISKLRVEQAGTVGLNITLNDIAVTGLAGLRFTDNFKLDLTNQVLSYEAIVPRLELISDYEMKGRILILPITGKGKANFTLVEAKLKTTSPFKDIRKGNGKEYIVFQEPIVSMQPKKAYLYFENLFNGDPLLGPNTNRFINENWKEIYDDVGPSITQSIVAAIQANLQTLLDKIPHDELILSG